MRSISGLSGEKTCTLTLVSGPFEQAVFEPLGLSNTQDVADGFERGYVRSLVGGVGHDEHDVDDGLGRQAGHGGRPGVLDQQCPAAERVADPLFLAREQPRPVRIVVDENDRPGGRRTADQRGAELVLGSHRATAYPCIPRGFAAAMS